MDVGGERGQTTVEWLGAMVALIALAGALVAALPAVAPKVTSAFEHMICRAGGGSCPAAPAPAPAPAPTPAPASPTQPPGTTFTKKACSKGGRTATFQVQTQLKRDPDTGKVFRVITGVTYRLNGPPGKIKVWVFQRAIHEYTDSGKRAGDLPGIGDLNGAEVGIGTQQLVRDGRAHTLDIGQWSAKDAPVGTYVMPDTNGVFQVHYDYVFVVDPGNDSGGCSFHYDG